MKMKSIFPLTVFASLAITLSASSCKKDDPETTTAPTGNFYKGNISSQPWEHGLVLRSNNTARYLYSLSGGSMSDTSNANVSKMEGTYQILTNDSMYVQANDGVSNVKLAGLLNSAHTSMQGSWKFTSGGITNTLTYNMSK